ncbi:hypothetical protein MMC11_007438 [Xylographa trunciseda]|nr:hypothetical protein [Xylographa trunciseda]
MRVSPRILWGVVLSLFSHEAQTLKFLSASITRPDLFVPKVTVHRNRLSTNDGDLLFLTSYRTGRDAPLIYDLQGSLVWAGDSAGRTEWHLHFHNLHTLEYRGLQHLAYSQVSLDASGLNVGGNFVLNSNYDVVAEFQKSTNITELDPHEFSILDNGTKLIQGGRIRHTSNGLSWKDGLVGESVFQVVDISTRETDFEWRSLDQIPLNESCQTVPDLDYFHLNSVVKDSQGNYILSGFHACTVYKVNGTDGSIIWRLGGKKSDFQMLDGYHLWRMHHVRIRDLLSIKLTAKLRQTVSEETHLALSIFDNAFDAVTENSLSAESSSAIVVLLDLRAMTGQVVERYPQPQGMYGSWFGSVQFLLNGDRFVGWGGQRTFSQHSQDGELMYHAEISSDADPTWSYRAFKGPWTGRPTTRPDLFTYSWTCFWNTTMYASWNGATEVARWRFYGSLSVSGVFTIVAVVAKESFETRAIAPVFASYAYVEALHRDGSVLGSSKIVQVHVPNQEVAAECSEFRCRQSFDWTARNDGDNCGKNKPSMFIKKPGQSVLDLGHRNCP